MPDCMKELDIMPLVPLGLPTRILGCNQGEFVRQFEILGDILV